MKTPIIAAPYIKMHKQNDTVKSLQSTSRWIAATCALIGTIGVVFGLSLLVGKRGIYIITGNEARWIGASWYCLGSLALVTLWTDSPRRKIAIITLLVLFISAIFATFIIGQNLIDQGLMEPNAN